MAAIGFWLILLNVEEVLSRRYTLCPLRLGKCWLSTKECHCATMAWPSLSRHFRRATRRILGSLRARPASIGGPWQADSTHKEDERSEQIHGFLDNRKKWFARYSNPLVEHDCYSISSCTNFEFRKADFEGYRRYAHLHAHPTAGV